MLQEGLADGPCHVRGIIRGAQSLHRLQHTKALLLCSIGTSVVVSNRAAPAWPGCGVHRLSPEPREPCWRGCHHTLPASPTHASCEAQALPWALAMDACKLTLPPPRQASIVQVLQADLAQIERLIKGAMDELQGRMHPGSAGTPLDKCQLMEAMHDNHLAQLLPRVDACEAGLSAFCQRCIDAKVGGPAHAAAWLDGCDDCMSWQQTSFVQIAGGWVGCEQHIGISVTILSASIEAVCGARVSVAATVSLMGQGQSQSS